MTTSIQKLTISMIFMALFAGPSLAKKPDSPGNSGKNKTEHRHEQGSYSNHEKASYQGFFDHERQSVIRD